MFLTSISQICRRDRVEDSVDSILILWILIWTFMINGLFVDDTHFCGVLAPRFSVLCGERNLYASRSLGWMDCIENILPSRNLFLILKITKYEER